MASTYSAAKTITTLLETVGPFDEGRASRMLATIESNSQVRDATLVPDRLRRMTGATAE